MQLFPNLKNIRIIIIAQALQTPAARSSTKITLLYYSTLSTTR